MKEKYNLKIKGMACEDCAIHVREALLKMPGIESVTVNLDSESAIAEGENSIPLSDFSDALDNAGYELISLQHEAFATR